MRPSETPALEPTMLHGDGFKARPSLVRTARPPPLSPRMHKIPAAETRMENPLLGPEPLPPFARIRPEHVEPGVRELLERSRARIEQLAALERPTFATVI